MSGCFVTSRLGQAIVRDKGAIGACCPVGGTRLTMTQRVLSDMLGEQLDVRYGA